MNRLYYGDNLAIMREHVADASVDLVYLDPPFNSNRAYNVIFARRDTVGDPASAQIHAFDDTWRWSPVTEQQYWDAIGGGLPTEVSNALTAMRTLLGENDAMAYLVNMAPRLVELHRVLKMTGSLYLHCDPTMSHYLKVLLDAIFGADRFINDISWRRSSTRSSISRIYRRAHDCLLYYGKTSAYTFNVQFRPLSDASQAGYSRRDDRGLYSSVPLLVSGTRNGDTGQPWRGIDPNAHGKNGMHWVTTREKLDKYDREGLVLWPAKPGGLPRLKYYAEDAPGVPVNDMWDDIRLIPSQSSESLGFPTQKPVALLERILKASSNAGDVVLDPFCGCGTTIDAAVRLERRWIGIDITYIAVNLVENRLKETFGDSIKSTYVVEGIPRDLAGARALFNASPFDFERWAVSLVDGTPNAKQVGDKGMDGVIRFPLGGPQRGVGRVLVSVKGGQQIGPAMVRDLVGAVNTQQAEMGLLITMAQPTRGMADAADHAGSYEWPVNGRRFPKIQIATVGDLLEGRRPPMPSPLPPYLSAVRRQVPADQLVLDAE